MNVLESRSGSILLEKSVDVVDQMFPRYGALF